MSGTELQYKYAVAKIEDIDELLNDESRQTMYRLLNNITEKRESAGKKNNSYIVVNTDEPYAHEIVNILKKNGHWGPGHNILQQPIGVNQLVAEAHQNAIDKGWHDEPRSFGDIIALIHSEVSEALEDFRNGHAFTEVWYEKKIENVLRVSLTQPDPTWKPCGIPSELADVVIRVFDACGKYGIDLETAIREKMAYNATRPHRHGNKKL